MMTPPKVPINYQLKNKKRPKGLSTKAAEESKLFGFTGILPIVSFGKLLESCRYAYNKISLQVKGIGLSLIKNKVKLVLVIGLGLITLSCIYVPWIINTEVYYAEFHFIWSPPHHYPHEYRRIIASIAYARIILEIIAIAAVTGIALLLISWTRNDSRSK